MRESKRALFLLHARDVRDTRIAFFHRDSEYPRFSYYRFSFFVRCKGRSGGFAFPQEPSGANGANIKERMFQPPLAGEIIIPSAGSASAVRQAREVLFIGGKLSPRWVWTRRPSTVRTRLIVRRGSRRIFFSLESGVYRSRIWKF